MIFFWHAFAASGVKDEIGGGKNYLLLTVTGSKSWQVSLLARTFVPSVIWFCMMATVPPASSSRCVRSGEGMFSSLLVFSCFFLYLWDFFSSHKLGLRILLAHGNATLIYFLRQSSRFHRCFFFPLGLSQFTNRNKIKTISAIALPHL